MPSLRSARVGERLERHGPETLARRDGRLVSTVARALALAACLLAASSPTAAHDWYLDLWSPDGERCCTKRDCRPVDHRYDRETGRLEVGIEGFWVPVDPAKLVPVPSTDGSTHACFKRRWIEGKKVAPVIRCVILPGEA